METRRKLPLPQSRDKKKIHVNVTVTIFKEGAFMVAYCPALELSSYGRTVEAAKKAFSQAMDIFIEETERRGTLERVLLSLGWSLRQKPSCRYEPPFFIPNRPARQAKAVDVMEQTVSIPCAPLRGTSPYAVHS